jgi:hypothetical protein
MGVTAYGGSTDSLASPSLSSWAASVATALDSSDTTVNTRITQRVMPLTAKTGNYTLTASDEVVTCNGTFTVTLPTAVGATGKQYVIRNIATTTVTIGTTSSQTVDGCSGTITLAGKGAFVVVSDGANWLVTSGQYTDESVGRRIFTWSSALSSGATTGWQMTFGDTGWRNISALLSNGWALGASFGKLHIRRQGSLVTIDADLSASAATAQTVFTVPTGFEPHRNMVCIGYSGSTGYNGFEMRSTADSSSTAFFSIATTGGLWRVTPNYQVVAAWPSSLPGSAVGSIPAS